jgi:hypothetical protein
MNLANSKFAFVQGNRPVDDKRLEKAIRAAGRVLIPIYGVYYGDIKESKIEVFDALTGELLNTPSDDCFVVLDGQHRTKTSLLIFKQEQEHLSNVDEPDASVTVFTETIPATVLESNDIEGNLQEMIMNINTTSKSWTSKDFVHSAHVLKKDDNIVSLIYWLINLGFSLSNISRILFFDHKALNNQILADYVDGNGGLPECNIKAKLELLRMLLGKGFRMIFLRKRYLYEAIIKKNNAQKYNEFVSALKQLDEDTVNKIECMTAIECDNGDIIKLVENFAKRSNCHHDAACVTFDMSEERFHDNVEFVHLKYEENMNSRKKAENSTGSKSKGAKATKQVKNVNCTLEDVV